MGAVYTALDRLERNGLVSSSIGDPTRERGGRAKRFWGSRHEACAPSNRLRMHWSRSGLMCRN